jgi:hypothetical protein
MCHENKRKAWKINYSKKIINYGFERLNIYSFFSNLIIQYSIYLNNQKKNDKTNLLSSQYFVLHNQIDTVQG